MWKYFWTKTEQGTNPYEVKFKSETGEETFIAVTNDIKNAEFIVAACTQFAIDYEDDEEK